MRFWIRSASSVRKKRLRRLISLGLAIPATLYGIAFVLTYTERFENIPNDVWASGDVRAVLNAARGIDRKLHSSQEDFDRLITETRQNASLPSVSEALIAAADAWVKELNRNNPHAILYHEVDSYGHLYVVFGGWWSTLSADEQLLALDGLGVAWRLFLQTHFGSWDGREGFAPGIIVVDEAGEVARNLNGQVIIHRPVIY